MKNILALGANMPSVWGNPAETLSQAVRALSERICDLSEMSRYFATEAVPSGSGPEFVNAAVVLEGEYDPTELLAICHSIERSARRSRDFRWGPRTLDIDLIACGDRILPDRITQDTWRTLPEVEQADHAPENLILPHPRVQDRAFVLVPMMDVAPNWRHPVLGETTAEMLARLPVSQRRAVRAIPAP